MKQDPRIRRSKCLSCVKQQGMKNCELIIIHRKPRAVVTILDTLQRVLVIR